MHIHFYICICVAIRVLCWGNFVGEADDDHVANPGRIQPYRSSDNLAPRSAFRRQKSRRFSRGCPGRFQRVRLLVAFPRHRRFHAELLVAQQGPLDMLGALAIYIYIYIWALSYPPPTFERFLFLAGS